LGFIDTEGKDGVKAKEMFKRFEHIKFRATDERDDSGPSSGSGSRYNGPMERDENTKF
jgi:hypothetical protein